MGVRVAIRFGPTKSSALPEAVRLASKLPSYSAGNGFHSIDEKVDAVNWATIFMLWTLVDQFSVKACEIEGRPATFADLVDIQAVFKCHDERAGISGGDPYCVSQLSPTDDPQYFGCRFARGVLLGHDFSAAWREPQPAWWLFGQLDPNHSSFLVDKEEILRVIENRTRHAAATSCPAWSMDRVRAVVKRLPVALVVGKGWRLRYSRLDETLPVGVEPSSPIFTSRFSLEEEP